MKLNGANLYKSSFVNFVMLFRFSLVFQRRVIKNVNVTSFTNHKLICEPCFCGEKSYRKIVSASRIMMNNYFSIRCALNLPPSPACLHSFPPSPAHPPRSSRHTMLGNNRNSRETLIKILKV